jgi:putative flippase GtrA
MPGRENSGIEKIQSDSQLLQLLAQVTRFGVVGLLATGVHILIFVGCIEILGIAPLWANFPAFLFALVTGFVGHFTWTFRMLHRGQQNNWWAALFKFMLVSFIGLGLNTLVVYLVVNLLGHPYPYAVLLMVTAVPVAVFLMQKLWAFN